MNYLSFEEFSHVVVDHIKEYLPEAYQDSHVQIQEVI